MQHIIYTDDSDVNLKEGINILKLIRSTSRKSILLQKNGRKVMEKINISLITICVTIEEAVTEIIMGK